MSENWPDILLGDVAEEITVGHVGPMATRYVSVGTPFLRSQNVKRLRLDLADVKFIPPDFHAQLAKSRLRPGDVVIVRTGEPGACAIIPDDLEDANCSDLVIVRPGKNLDAHFLAYYVNVAASHHVASHLVGAVQQHFNVSAARTLPMKLPPLTEQKEIAAVLGSLDDKIEQNRRTGRKLEGLARGVFKAWFVDFAPVKAKAAGATAFPGMPAETFAALPTRLVDSELGPVPEGWAPGKLSSVAEVIMGTSPPSSTYNDEGIGVALINGPVEYGERFPIRAKWTTAEVKQAIEGDLIFCVRGSTTGRRVISDGTYGLGRGVCAIRGKNNAQPFINVLVESELPRLLADTTGSVFPSLSAPSIKGFSIVVPANEQIQAFCATTAPMIEATNAAARESAKLAALRDYLLPRLLSGKVRVAGVDAAIAVDAADHDHGRRAADHDHDGDRLAALDRAAGRKGH